MDFVAVLKQHIADYEAQREKVVAQANAIIGALGACKQLLEQLTAPAVEAPVAEPPIE